MLQLIDPDIADVPVCLLELGRITADKDGTLILVLDSGTSTIGPSRLAEVTAELSDVSAISHISTCSSYRGIKYHSIIREIGIDITAGTIKGRGRQSPARRIRVARRDVKWDAVSREKPDPNGVGFPLHSIYTAIVGVEAGTITDRALAKSTTALTIGTSDHVILAVVTVGGAGHFQRRLGDNAAASCVQ